MLEACSIQVIGLPPPMPRTDSGGGYFISTADENPIMSPPAGRSVAEGAERPY
jgi:hypothetical protein